MMMSYKLVITVELSEDELRRMPDDFAARNRLCIMAANVFGSVRAGVDGVSTGGRHGQASADILRMSRP